MMDWQVGRIMFNPQPKPVRWVCEKYKGFVREHACVFCGKPGPSQAHHLRQFEFTGTALKPSDSYCVPVCKDCHDKDQMYPCHETWLIKECVKLLTEWLSK